MKRAFVLIAGMACQSASQPSWALVLEYECRAERAGGAVAFSVHEPKRPELGMDGRRVPVVAVEVRKVTERGPRMIWGVRADDENGADAVVYGVVPAGYSQYVPEHGEPPPIEPNREYEISCGASSGRFRMTSKGVENLKAH